MVAAILLMDGRAHAQDVGHLQLQSPSLQLPQHIALQLGQPRLSIASTAMPTSTTAASLSAASLSAASISAAPLSLATPRHLAVEAAVEQPEVAVGHQGLIMHGAGLAAGTLLALGIFYARGNDHCYIPEDDAEFRKFYLSYTGAAVAVGIGLLVTGILLRRGRRRTSTRWWRVVEGGTALTGGYAVPSYFAMTLMGRRLLQQLSLC